MKKGRLFILAMSILALLMIPSLETLSYLVHKTDSVVNAFTVGAIQIRLDETERNYPYHPGGVIPKDPKVTVLKNSEEAYLYVYVQNKLSSQFTTDMSSTDWEEVLSQQEGTVSQSLYRYKNPIPASTLDQTIPVFTKVSVALTLTNAQARLANNKTLTIQAYAHQMDGVSEAQADANAKAKFWPVQP